MKSSLFELFSRSYATLFLLVCLGFCFALGTDFFIASGLKFQGLGFSLPVRHFLLAFWVHGGWLHLLSNALMILVLGSFLEREWGLLPHLGSLFTSAGVSLVIAYYLHPHQVTIGISGGAFGWSALFLFARARVLFWEQESSGKWRGGLALMVFSLGLLASFWFSPSTGIKIDHWAHGLGFAIGLSWIPCLVFKKWESWSSLGLIVLWCLVGWGLLESMPASPFAI